MSKKLYLNLKIMLLEKWHWQTCLVKGWSRPSICKKKKKNLSVSVERTNTKHSKTGSECGVAACLREKATWFDEQLGTSLLHHQFLDYSSGWFIYIDPCFSNFIPLTSQACWGASFYNIYLLWIFSLMQCDFWLY